MEEDIEVYYLKVEYIDLMLDTSKITKEALNETHVRMPAFPIGGLTFDSPDDVFTILNDEADVPNPYSFDVNQDFIREHQTHTSMSVGDVVKMKGKFYICEDIGWRVL